MGKKNIEELNLMDDFLMGSVLSYPVVGPEVCRKMISIILSRKSGVGSFRKSIFRADTDKHGTRLDVCRGSTGRRRGHGV